MKHHRLLIIISALLLSGLITAQAASHSIKENGIGGTGAPVMRDGIGGTGAPARDGIGGTGAPTLNDGIGGTGSRPDDKSAVLAGVAGHVLFIAGQVEADNPGQIRQLVKGDPVRVGDTLKSGSGASLQLRMEDGGTIVLRAKSQLIIESFVYNGAEDGSEHMALALLTGGFRAVTGNIGHLHKENYSIRTPNATIGIRGTDHETVFVPQPPAGQTAVVDPGTYDHVISGATMLQDKHGGMLIKPNQTGFAALKGAEPIILNRTLPIFGDQKANTEKRGKQNGESEMRGQHGDVNNTGRGENGNTGSSDHYPDTEQNPKGGYSTGSATGNLSGSMPDTGQNSNDPTQNTQQNSITQSDRLGNTSLDLNTLETNGSPATPGSAVVGAHLSSGLMAVGSAQTGNPGVTLLAEGNDPGSYANNVSGFNFIANEADSFSQGTAQVDGVTVSWGIYAGGIAFDPSGKAITINFHPFAYAIEGATPATVVSTMRGSATFSNVAGYTKPVTESGNMGGSVNLNIAINLGASTVTSYNLTVTDANARNWTGSLVNGTPVALATFANGTPLAVSCSGSGVATGSAAGLLIGPNAKGLISSYVLSTTNGQAVTGAVLMSRP